MQKKSLVNTLKSTKKEINVIAAQAKNEGTTSRKTAAKKAAITRRGKYRLAHYGA
jgi:hypothetical protein